MDKLSKLEEIIKVLDKDVPSTEEVAELVSIVVSVVADTKETLEKQAKENKRDLHSFTNQTIEEALARLDELTTTFQKKVELNTTQYLKKETDKTKSEIDSLAREMFVELSKIKSLIKEPDFSEVNKKFGEFESKLAEIANKPESPAPDLSNLIVGDGVSKITVSRSAPSNPQQGDLWVEIR